MWKRILATLLAWLCVLFALPAAAKADAVVTPWDRLIYGDATAWLLAALLLALLVGTAILIPVLMKRRKRKKDSE